MRLMCFPVMHIKFCCYVSRHKTWRNSYSDFSSCRTKIFKTPKTRKQNSLIHKRNLKMPSIPKPAGLLMNAQRQQCAGTHTLVNIYTEITGRHSIRGSSFHSILIFLLFLISFFTLVYVVAPVTLWHWCTNSNFFSSA